MKLRIEPGALRLRLSEEEAKRLKEATSLEESFSVAGRDLTWAIRAGDTERLEIGPATWTVYVLDEKLRHWQSAHTVLATFTIPNSEPLLIMTIERDLGPRRSKPQ